MGAAEDKAGRNWRLRGNADDATARAFDTYDQEVVGTSEVPVAVPDRAVGVLIHNVDAGTIFYRYGGTAAVTTSNGMPVPPSYPYFLPLEGGQTLRLISDVAAQDVRMVFLQAVNG